MEQAIETGTQRGAGQRPGARRRTAPKRAGRAPRALGSIPVDWEALARSTAHHLRISILEVMGMDGGRVMSPNELSFELQVYLAKIDYHVDQLRRAGLIELVRTEPRRGATEHFYRLAPR